MAKVFDETRCTLGEGALWHPKRQELIWFDILGKKMFRKGTAETIVTELDEVCSAAFWVDEARVVVATQTALVLRNLDTGEVAKLVDLEAENTVTRSNDGRADPWGGLWIGTMGFGAEHKAGAFYRYYKGELRQLFPDVTIPNSTCFAPDKSRAYFSDTARGKLFSVTLDADGWPNAKPDVFVDFAPMGLNPDGAVTDAEGNLWIAFWGAARVGVYSPQGQEIASHPMDAAQVTCPAFGGADLTTLFCTSASEGLSEAEASQFAGTGQVFVQEHAGQGREEYAVQL